MPATAATQIRAAQPSDHISSPPGKLRCLQNKQNAVRKKEECSPRLLSGKSSLPSSTVPLHILSRIGNNPLAGFFHPRPIVTKKWYWSSQSPEVADNTSIKPEQWFYLCRTFTGRWSSPRPCTLASPSTGSSWSARRWWRRNDCMAEQEMERTRKFFLWCIILYLAVRSDANHVNTVS